MTTRTECIQIYVLRLVPFVDAYYAFFVPVNIQQVLSCLLRYILPERFLVYRVQRAMCIKMFNKCWKMFQRVRRMAKNKNKKGFHCGEAGRKRVKSEISAIFNFVGFVSPKHCEGCLYSLGGVRKLRLLSNYQQRRWGKLFVAGKASHTQKQWKASEW